MSEAGDGADRSRLGASSEVARPSLKDCAGRYLLIAQSRDKRSLVSTTRPATVAPPARHCQPDLLPDERRPPWTRPAPRHHDRRCRQPPHLIDNCTEARASSYGSARPPSRAPSLRCRARSRVEVGSCTPSARRMKDGTAILIALQVRDQLATASCWHRDQSTVAADEAPADPIRAHRFTSAHRTKCPLTSRRFNDLRARDGRAVRQKTKAC